MNSEYTHIKHEFEPVFDKNSKILVLGTLPSVKSRENNFYYGHPQNRFWKLIAALCDEDIVPQTIDRIYANGGKAYELYMKYQYGKTGREIIKLPSTSPANAAYSLERLLECWQMRI